MITDGETYTTDRAKENYLAKRGIKPCRTDKNTDGVILFVYKLDDQTRKVLREYAEDLSRKFNEKLLQATNEKRHLRSTDFI